ncbi:MAG: hypothetical protein EBT03_11350 [Betaproteobacteria bacterium]|nr:hypothetical protein [Betaproteobacteria bacterium]NCA17443.1 hypothetical protein [Betaproteobacteria bacterium]
MIATLRFDLADPDEARDHRAALAGRDALIELGRVAEYCHQSLDRGEIGDEARVELERIRAMISVELTSLLH